MAKSKLSSVITCTMLMSPLLRWGEFSIMDLSSGSGKSTAGVQLDCTIYVDSADRATASQIVARALGGRVEPYGLILSPSMAVYSAHNDYESGSGASQDFIEWVSVFECQPSEGVDEEVFVKGVRDCLQALWLSHFRAVAACDFEERLPFRGGIERFS
ncbi:hypothetical protein ACPC3D_28620 [Streptomyces cellulosae]